MKKILTFIAAAAAALSLSSCASTPDISDRWTITAFKGETVKTMEKPAFLGFDPQTGRVHGCLGVNLVAGDYTLEKGGKLTIGKLGMTMMAGPREDMDLERQMSLACETVAKVKALDEDTLALYDGEGNEVFTLKRGVKDPDAKPMVIVDPEEDKPATPAPERRK